MISETLQSGESRCQNESPLPLPSRLSSCEIHPSERLLPSFLAILPLPNFNPAPVGIVEKKDGCRKRLSILIEHAKS